MIAALIAVLVFALISSLSLLSAIKERQRVLRELNRRKRNVSLRRLNSAEDLQNQVGAIPKSMHYIIQKRRRDELINLKELGQVGLNEQISCLDIYLKEFEKEEEEFPFDNLNVDVDNEYKSIKQKNLILLINFLSREVSLRGVMHPDFTRINFEMKKIEATVFFAGVSEAVQNGIKDYNSDFLGTSRSYFEKVIYLSDANPEQAFHCKGLIDTAKEYLVKIQSIMIDDGRKAKQLEPSGGDGLDRMFNSSKRKETWKRA